MQFELPKIVMLFLLWPGDKPTQRRTLHEQWDLGTALVHLLRASLCRPAPLPLPGSHCMTKDSEPCYTVRIVVSSCIVYVCVYIHVRMGVCTYVHLCACVYNLLRVCSAKFA